MCKEILAAFAVIEKEKQWWLADDMRSRTTPARNFLLFSFLSLTINKYQTKNNLALSNSLTLDTLKHFSPSGK